MGEKFKRSQEWEECLLGHRHYVEQSGAKWGWTTRQQSVLRYYPQTPPPTLSKPPRHHCHRVPLLCGVIPPATQQWPHHHLLEGEWRSGRQRGCGVLFMWRGLQSLCIFYACTASLLQMSVGCDVMKNKTYMKIYSLKVARHFFYLCTPQRITGWLMQRFGDVRWIFNMNISNTLNLSTK